MALSQKLHVEELDDESREYLLEVRKSAGRGMPGLFVRKTYALPVLGLIFGIVLMIVMAIISAQLITESPLAVAMLETIGLLAGGWMIVAAFRVWTAAKGSRYLGHFIYADAETLWECGGTCVTVTDLCGIVEARAVENLNQGKYANTAITVRTDRGFRTFTVANEERARRLNVFLNTLAWMRDGGEADQGAHVPDGEQINWKKLPAGIMGGVAKEYAISGEMPRELTAQALELDVSDIPTPKKVGRVRSGILNYLLIIAIGVGSVFVFKEMNVPLRDEAIWDHINDIPDRDERAPILRGYLADPRNAIHRDDAQRMLTQIYDENINRMRIAQNVDPKLFSGLAELLKHIAGQRQAIISVSVKENGATDDPKPREKAVRDQFTLALFNGVGKELAGYVQAPPDTPGLIDITVDYGQEKNIRGINESVAYFTIRFRKNPDDEPFASAKVYLPATRENVGNAASQIGLRTAGPARIKLQRINVDF